MIYIEECINVPEPENFAILLYHKYNNKFRCISITKKVWQVKNENEWLNIEDGYLLYKLISTEILKEFETYVLEMESNILTLKKKKSNLETKEIILSINKKITEGKKILKKLKNITFKNKIMREAAILFYIT